MALRWQDATCGLVSGLRWTRWTDETRHVDPYLVWADVTGFQALWHRAAGGPWTDQSLPLLIELDESASLWLTPGRETDLTRRDCSATLAQLAIPALYRRTAGDGSQELHQRFFTARCPPGALCHLMVDPCVKRIQLGLPRVPAVDTRRPIYGDLPTSGTPRPRTIVGFIDDGCAFAHGRFTGPDGATRLRWLWDQDDRRAPTAKWQAVDELLYGAELGPQELSAAARLGGPLDPYVSVDYVPVRLDAESHTTSIGTSDPRRPPAAAMLTGTHGTGVMDLAVGWPQAPQRTQAVPAASPREGFDRPVQADYDTSATCPLIFVQLPTQTVLDTSGGSLGVHVLDGIHYILERALRVPYLNDPTRTEPLDVERQDNQVVVNVSFGAIGGCHDGTSILEQAIDELVFVRKRQRLWIVLAAGNANRSRTHSRVDLSPQQAKQFHWYVAPDHPHESYLEIWLPDAERDAARPLPEQEVKNFQLRVVPPDGDPLPLAMYGDVQVFVDDTAPDDLPRAGVVFARRVSQGLRGTMVLLAVAPTRIPLAGEPRGRAPGLHGWWRVEVAYTPAGAATTPTVRIHAWTERNDLVYGNLRPQQAQLWSDEPVPEPTEFTGEALSAIHQCTPPWVTSEFLPRPLQADSALASLAGSRPARKGYEESLRGHGAVVVAGAYRVTDGEMSPDSSGGPSRLLADTDERAELWKALSADAASCAAFRTSARAGSERVAPDIDAPGDFAPSVRGLRVCGMRDGDRSRVGGTSAAAAGGTRHLADAAYGNEVSSGGWPAPTLDGGAGDPLPRPARAARPSATPAMDDAFRRGRRRLR